MQLLPARPEWPPTEEQIPHAPEEPAYALKSPAPERMVLAVAVERHEPALKELAEVRVRLAPLEHELGRRLPESAPVLCRRVPPEKEPSSAPRAAA